MRKQVIARTCKIAAVLLAFLISLNAVYCALSFKYGDGIMDLKCLYRQEKDSVDLLVLGSSHAFENINTGVLYDSYGIAAYVLAGSVQPYWNTYYYLLEALKTQSPKLVVLDAYASAFTDEYSDHSRIIKNTLGLRDVAMRYDALKVSAPEEKRTDYLFDYRLWHSRYTELGASDFSEYYRQPLWEYNKGFGINFATMPFDRPDPDAVTGTATLHEKTEEYYRKIIELCQRENLPLLIVKSPYVLSEAEQELYNMSAQIAQEYTVPFVNFNSSYYYDAMGLDFSQDYGDWGHLNYRGNVKYTHALAKEILSRYDLPDRRGQPGYESWERNSEYLLGRTEDEYLRNETDFASYLTRLNRDRYTIAMMAISGADKILASSEETLREWGIDADTVKDGSLYVIRGGALKQSCGDVLWERTIELDGHMLALEQSADSKLVHSLRWDGTERVSDENGCYLAVYDNVTQELVEISHLTWSENTVTRNVV